MITSTKLKDILFELGMLYREGPFFDEEIKLITKFKFLGYIPAKSFGATKFHWEDKKRGILVRIARTTTAYNITISYSKKQGSMLTEPTKTYYADKSFWDKEDETNISAPDLKLLKRILEDTDTRLKKVTAHQIKEDRGRPKVGMKEPQLKDGDRVRLFFTTQEKNLDLAKKNSHKRDGRIYDIENTPNGKFYVIRLFVAVQGNEKAVDKLYGITDKQVKKVEAKK